MAEKIGYRFVKGIAIPSSQVHSNPNQKKPIDKDINSSWCFRSCWALAQTYAPLSRDLFNAAFVSCWTVLSSSIQQELINTLEQALNVPDLPEITQTILNLAEFMEHCEKVIGIGKTYTLVESVVLI